MLFSDHLETAIQAICFLSIVMISYERRKVKSFTLFCLHHNEKRQVYWFIANDAFWCLKGTAILIIGMVIRKSSINHEF